MTPRRSDARRGVAISGFGVRVPDGLLRGHLDLDAGLPLGLGVLGDRGLECVGRVDPGLACRAASTSSVSGVV